MRCGCRTARGWRPTRRRASSASSCASAPGSRGSTGAASRPLPAAGARGWRPISCSFCARTPSCSASTVMRLPPKPVSMRTARSTSPTGGGRRTTGRHCARSRSCVGCAVCLWTPRCWRRARDWCARICASRAIMAGSRATTSGRRSGACITSPCVSARRRSRTAPSGSTREASMPMRATTGRKPERSAGRWTGIGWRTGGTTARGCSNPVRPRPRSSTSPSYSRRFMPPMTVPPTRCAIRGFTRRSECSIACSKRTIPSTTGGRRRAGRHLGAIAPTAIIPAAPTTSRHWRPPSFAIAPPGAAVGAMRCSRGATGTSRRSAPSPPKAATCQSSSISAPASKHRPSTSPGATRPSSPARRRGAPPVRPRRPRRMRRALGIVLFVALLPRLAAAQSLEFHAPASVYDPGTPAVMRDLASRIIPGYRNDDRERFLADMSALQLVAGTFEPAYSARLELQRLRGGSSRRPPADFALVYDLYAHTKALQAQYRLPFAQAFDLAFWETIPVFDNLDGYRVESWLQAPPAAYAAALQASFDRLRGHPRIGEREALGLVWQYLAFDAYRSFGPIAPGLISLDEDRRYIIQDDVVADVPGRGKVLALLVRPRSSSGLLTTLLEYR